MKILLALFSLLSAPSSAYLQHHHKLRVQQTASSTENHIEGSYIVVYKSHVDDVHHRARRFLLHHEDEGDIKYIFNSALTGIVVKDASEDALQHFLDDEDVAYVEQDRILNTQMEEEKTFGTPEDVISSAAQQGEDERDLWLLRGRTPQWNLDRIDQRDLPLDGSYEPAYDGTGVNIYVLGDHFYSTLDTRGRASCDISTAEGLKCEGGLFSKARGSLSVAIAGAAAGTRYGVAKGANLIGVRYARSRTEGSGSDLIAAYDWVSSEKMMNPDQPMVCFTYVTAGSVFDSLDAAVNSTAAAGVVTIVPALNSDQDSCSTWPGTAEGGILVSDVNAQDERTSGYGSCVDIFAPGEKIKTLSRLGVWPNDGGGTGFSSAHVAGAAAMYLQRDPTMSPEDVRASLIADATVDKISNPGTNTPNRILYVGNIN